MEVVSKVEKNLPKVAKQNVRAEAKNLHITARKCRLAVDLIRNKNVKEAIKILQLTNKKAARLVLKVLNSAIANATHNNSYSIEKMFVAKTYVNEARTLKRVHPRARGRSYQILKRYSHIIVEVAERGER